MSAEELYEAYRREVLRKGGHAYPWKRLGKFEQECWEAAAAKVVGCKL